MKSTFLIIVLICLFNFTGLSQRQIQGDSEKITTSDGIIPDSTKQKQEPFIPNNNYLSMGLGGGLTGFAFSFTYYYKFIGVGFSMAGGNAPSEESNCEECFASRYYLPYDWVDTEQFRVGLLDYRLLFKIPIIHRFYITGSIGYYEDKWVDVTTYIDAIYPKEVRWGNKEIKESGISYGGGIFYDFAKHFSMGLEFTNKVGGIIFLSYTF